MKREPPFIKVYEREPEMNKADKPEPPFVKAYKREPKFVKVNKT